MVESQLTSVSRSLAEESTSLTREDSYPHPESQRLEKISKTIVKLMGQQVLRELLAIPEVSPAVVSNFEQLMTIVQDLKSLLQAQSVPESSIHSRSNPDDLTVYAADEAYEVLAALKDHAAQVGYLSVSKQFFLQRYLPIEKLMPRLLWYVARSHYDHIQWLGGVQAKISWDQENWQSGILRLVPVLEADAPDLHWQLDLVLNKAPQAILVDSTFIQWANPEEQPEIRAEQLLHQVTSTIQATTFEAGMFLEPMDVEFLEPGKNWQAGSLRLRFGLAFIPHAMSEPDDHPGIDTSNLNTSNLDTLLVNSPTTIEAPKEASNIPQVASIASASDSPESLAPPEDAADHPSSDEPNPDSVRNPGAGSMVKQLNVPERLSSILAQIESLTQGHQGESSEKADPEEAELAANEAAAVVVDDSSPDLLTSDPEAIAALVGVIEAQNGIEALNEDPEPPSLNMDLEEETIAALHLFLDVPELQPLPPSPANDNITLEVFQAELEPENINVDSMPSEPTLELFQAELTAVLGEKQVPETTIANATFAEITIPPDPQATVATSTLNAALDDTPTLAIFEQEIAEVIPSQMPSPEATTDKQVNRQSLEPIPSSPLDTSGQDEATQASPAIAVDEQRVTEENGEDNSPNGIREVVFSDLETLETSEAMAESGEGSEAIVETNAQPMTDLEACLVPQPDPTLCIALVDEIPTAQLAAIEMRRAIVQALPSLAEIYCCYRQPNHKLDNGIGSSDSHITYLVNLACQLLETSQASLQAQKAHLDQYQLPLHEWITHLFWQVTRGSYELMQLVRGVPAAVLQPDRGWHTGTLRLLTSLNLKDGEQNWSIDLSTGALQASNHILDASVILQSDAVELLQEPMQGQELLAALLDRLNLDSTLLQILTNTTPIKIFQGSESLGTIVEEQDGSLKLTFELELVS